MSGFRMAAVLAAVLTTGLVAGCAPPGTPAWVQTPAIGAGSEPQALPTTSQTEEPAAVGATATPETAESGPVIDVASLAEALQARGATVETAGEVSQPFFSVQGQVLKVNGEDVQVFIFPDAASAEQAAGGISPDGSSIATTMINWVAPPHFYRANQLISIYIGDDAKIKAALTDALAPQFAGR